jgi:hypothetical protein
MVVLISRQQTGYYVDYVDTLTGVMDYRPLADAPVAADEAFRLACQAGASEDEAFEALDDADRRWHHVVRAWRSISVLGGPARIDLPPLA